MKQFLFFLAILTGLNGTYAQNVRINEFSSYNISFLDKDLDTPDWFELYNDSDEPVNLLGWSISDDTTDHEAWVFPDVILQAKAYLLVFASGKDIKSLTYYDNILAWGSEMSYKIGDASIPPSWKLADFDDNEWAIGPSGFGYGDDDDATEVPESTLSVFVRKTFPVSRLNGLKELWLHIDFDDGFVAYLNGVEIARENMGNANSVVSYNQTATLAIEPQIVKGSDPKSFDISEFAYLLNEGENVLAIQVHNKSAGSSDLTLIPFLTIGYSNPVDANKLPKLLGLKNTSLHTDFSIDDDGERLFLCNSEGQLADVSDSVALGADLSYGYGADGNTYYFGLSTPGVANDSMQYERVYAGAVRFDPKGGIYSKDQYVTMTVDGGYPIYYTTDGSVPTKSSMLYTEPIFVGKTMAITARPIVDSLLVVNDVVQTYVLDDREFTLPVVSMTTDPYNLWDWDYGIYVLGPNAETKNPYFGANFWMDWERPIYLEYYDQKGKQVISQPAGTKIAGNWTRAKDQKLMAIFARKQYGEKQFKYKFFDERSNDEFSSLVLRNSGNDRSKTGFRDGFMTGLLKDVDLERPAFQASSFYLNGTYWGTLNVREKVNEDFLEDNITGVDAKKVDMLEKNATVLEGSNEHYNLMMDFVKSNDLSVMSNYEQMRRWMEVENFMDYEACQIYFDNKDWPNNNIKFWRPQTENGRWRWIVYDTDFGFGNGGNTAYENNTLAYATAPSKTGGHNSEWSTLLLRSLLENNDFKRDFINRFADRINYDFEANRVEKALDSMKAIIAPEVPFHNEKWGHLSAFDSKVEVMRNFAIKRPVFMRGFINSHFNLEGQVTLSVDVSDEKQGYVKVSSLYPKTYPWSGIYFKGNPVNVEACSYPGYEFSHWEGADIESPSLWLSVPKNGMSVKAIFKAVVRPYNEVVINEINYRSLAVHNCGDWIELYNTTDYDIDLSAWVLKDSKNDHCFKIPYGTILKADGYLVICANVMQFNSVHPDVNNSIGNLNFGLSSSEDAVRLYDSQKILIDSLFYVNEYPWVSINDSSGSTLALKDPLLDNGLWNYWYGSKNLGTPGASNGQYVSLEPRALQQSISASCFPNPFNKHLVVRWQVFEPSFVRVDVRDIKGVLVCEPFIEYCYNGTFEYVWNTDEKISSGIYFVRLTTNNGTILMLKAIKQ